MITRFLHLLRTPWVIGGFLAVLLSGLGMVWFYANFERKEYEAHVGASPAVRENPLLAAETYLRTLGLPTESCRDMEFLNYLPPVGDAIFIHRLPGVLDKAVSDRLYGWAEAGGHLLFVPSRHRSDHPGRGDLAERLGVGFLEEADDGDCGCPPSTDKKEQGESAGEPTTDGHGTKKHKVEGQKGQDNKGYEAMLDLNIEDLAIRLRYIHGPLLTGGDRLADYRIGGSYRLVDPQDGNLPDNNKIIEKEGDWLLEYRIGAGRITVLSDARLFQNHAIGEHDHAFFLSWLLRGAKRVWLLHGLQAESLPALLAGRLPQLWLSLAVLLILAVWKAQQRIGSRLRPESTDRRNFLGHIDAVGFHNWRIDRAAALLSANRRNMLQEWAGRRLGLAADRDNMDIDLARLAPKSGVGADEVHEAFTLEVQGEQDLIRIGRAMQKIEMQGKERHDG